MANERWPVLSPSGSEVLQVTDGLYYTAAGMGASQNDNCHVYVEFFTDAEGTVLASPTAGTVSAQGSPMGGVWLASSTGQTINASDVKLIGNYTPFVFTGRMERGRIGFDSIAGAITARVTFWRF